MNKSALKITAYIFKYLSILTLLVVIVFITDIPSNTALGEMKSVFQSFTVFLRTNIQLTSIILFICVVAIFICDLIIHFIKLYDKSDELDKISTEKEMDINKCNDKYTELIKVEKEIKKGIEKTEKQLFEEKYKKINKLSEHYVIMKAHLERRKSNYFSVNQRFYDIVKTSRNIDNETLQLINHFENELIK